MARKDWLDFRDGAAERDLIWEKFAAQLRTPYEPVRVPFMAGDKPADFVARSEEFEALTGLLLDQSSGEAVAITAALKGAGGFGKTTLARALCHDERIQAAYEDGVLWVELGENPGDLRPKLADLVETLSGERPGFDSLEALRTRLTEVLAERRILLVIDDVWDQAHLKPFLGGGSYCARLVTTRNADTVPAAVRKIPLDAMKAAEAVALLTAGLSPDGLPSERLTALAKRLGEWPLLLRLANGTLRSRIEDYQQPVTAALDYLTDSLDEFGIIALDDPNDPAARDTAVAGSIGVSLRLLNPEEIRRYDGLAVFLEDVDIPFETLGKLWALKDIAAERLAERLAKLSLILKFDPQNRRIRLHDVIRAYLIGRGRESGGLALLHRHFLTAYNLPRWADLPDSEPYLWDHLAHHLGEAGQGAALAEAVLDLRYLARKTLLRNAFAAERDLLAAQTAAPSPPLSALLPAFANMTHLLKDCQTLADTASTLHSRLAHLPELDAARARLEAEIPRPYIGLWHALPDLPHPALRRTLSGHDNWVNGCAISPDGNWIVSASLDATLKVWDAASGVERLTLKGHGGWVRGCAISPDGNWIVSASEDTTLKVWDAASGVERLTLKGHRSSVHGCAISPDGSWIVSASEDTTLKVWDAASGVERLTLSGHGSSVNGCAISPDGSWIVSASDDETLKVWDAASGVERLTLKGHDNIVYGCAISPDGRWIVSASLDATLKVWDAASGVERRTLSGHGWSVNGCAISPDGSWIVSASTDATLKVWDAASGLCRATLRVDGALYTCAWSPDGDYIIAGGARGLYWLRWRA